MRGIEACFRKAIQPEEGLFLRLSQCLPLAATLPAEPTISTQRQTPFVPQLTRSRLLNAAGVLALLLGSYWIAANVFLLPTVGARLLSKNDKAVYTWDRAHSWWPGRLTVYDLEISAATRRNGWYLRLPRATARVSLWRLLLKEFRASGIDTAAVDFRLRPWEGEAAPWFPQIPRLEELVRPTGPKRGGRPWTLDLGVKAVRGAETLHYGGYQLDGDLDVAGRTRFRLRRESFSLRDLRVRLRDGQWTAKGELTGDALEADAEASLATFSPKQVEWAAALSGLDARIDLQGEVESLAFLRPLVRSFRGVDLNGSGALEVALEIEDGRPLPGGALTIEDAQVELSLLEHGLSGSGRVAGTVERSGSAVETRLHVEAENVSLTSFRGGDPLGSSASGTVTADLIARDWQIGTEDPDAEAHVIVPGIELSDVALLSDYLPQSADFEIVRGSGLVSGEFHYENRGRGGSLDLAVSTDATVRWRDLVLLGRAELDAVARDLDLDRRSAVLETTKLTFREVRTSDAPEQRWAGELEVESGCYFGETAPSVDATLRARLDDTRPLVALFAERRHFLGWFESLLDFRDIEATSRVVVDRRGGALENLEVQGETVEARGNVDLRGDGARGLLFLRYRALSAAVELDGSGDRDWKLTDSRDWYQERQAEQPQIPRICSAAEASTR